MIRHLHLLFFLLNTYSLLSQSVSSIQRTAYKSVEYIDVVENHYKIVPCSCFESPFTFSEKIEMDSKNVDNSFYDVLRNDNINANNFETKLIESFLKEKFNVEEEDFVFNSSKNEFTVYKQGLILGENSILWERFSGDINVFFASDYEVYVHIKVKGSYYLTKKDFPPSGKNWIANSCCFTNSFAGKFEDYFNKFINKFCDNLRMKLKFPLEDNGY